MKKQKIKGGQKNLLKKAIVEIFSANPNVVLNYKQLSHALNISSPDEKRNVNSILLELSDTGFLMQPSVGQFRLDVRTSFLTGYIDKQSVAKKTFLIPDDGGEPVFIAERSLNRAMNHDYVKVHLFACKKGQAPEGEVVEIIRRHQDTFVGQISVVDNSYAFVNIDKKILPFDIFVPIEKIKNARNHQKVLVKIINWEEKDKNPIGEVVDVLGYAGDNNTEMHAILAEFGLPYRYPKEVEDAADKIDEKISATEIARRKDLRDVVTFTIDPRDAKDFDDALSFQKIDDNSFEIGVHIADVTHYVKENDIINKEAYKRATSVYLVDRTIPMLPEKLCNNICSLRPNEDKLAYSVIFKMNAEAEVLDYEITRTVIHSDRRFTYEEAQEILEKSEGDFSDELLQMNALAKKLREQRFQKGAIAFDRVEVRFEIDKKGKPLSVFFKEAKDANKLIEEFMLLANKTVAIHIGKPKTRGTKPSTFVYRVHDVPNPEKLSNFAQFIKRFGYKLKTSGKNIDISTSINSLLNDVQGKKEQNLIEVLAVRSMAKATYTTDNIGHYGLAFDYYTHFTSPIRRYPDMMVHRLLTKYADGQRSVNKDDYEDFCAHSSEMEQLASSAERASIKYKQVEFMSDKIGQIFDGIIVGITEWGVYVELNENKCEGMVSIRDLGTDYFEYDDKNYCIVGKRSGKKYQLGDDVTVRIARTNLAKKQLDLELVN